MDRPVRRLHRPAARRLALLGAMLSACCALAGCAHDSGKGPGVALIIKTQTNPYFVSMVKAARQSAARTGADLSVAAGNADGDTQTQINAVYTAIARGDKGIMITSNGASVNAALRQAKHYGLFVIALDTPLSPASTADETFATDNEKAGELIGKYAAAKLGGKRAIIAMLDLYNDQVVSVDLNRDHGFLKGMGIDPGSPSQTAKEKRKGHYSGGKGGSYEIACHRPTLGAIDGGRTGMEQCLSRRPDINVVYSINEPAGEGAYDALKAAGKQHKAFVVSIDGSCHGMDNVKAGVYAADATQYPAKMAQLGLQSIAHDSGKGSGGKPGFVDTGTKLVTTHPFKGLPSQTPGQASKACWGSSNG